MRSTWACASSAFSSRELDVDDAAHPNPTHLEAELSQRPLDGLALWVENPVLGSNEDGRSHSTTSGSSR